VLEGFRSSASCSDRGGRWEAGALRLSCPRRRDRLLCARVTWAPAPASAYAWAGGSVGALRRLAGVVRAGGGLRRWVGHPASASSLAASSPLPPRRGRPFRAGSSCSPTAWAWASRSLRSRSSTTARPPSPVRSSERKRGQPPGGPPGGRDRRRDGLRLACRSWLAWRPGSRPGARTPPEPPAGAPRHPRRGAAWSGRSLPATSPPRWGAW